jgi:membrane protein implicated in regulation of membrane protease activity
MVEVLILGFSIKVWEVLAVVGVVLAALEIFAPGFILLPIGLAFLIASVAAIFLSTPLAILSALAVSLCFLIWLFQFKLKMGLPGKAVLDSNVDGMVGSKVEITSKVSGGGMGDVKLYGDVWRAYSESKRTYEEGEKALVIRVDGNKLVLD